jgi:hypothetical protein
MKARSQFVMGWLLLATLGCGTRSTLIQSDAGARKDSAAGADSPFFPDALEVATGMPDLTSNRDAEQREDTSQVVPPDLAAPDLSPDNAVRDATSDASTRDVLIGDVVALSDSSSRDVAVDAVVPDVVSSDVGLTGSPDVVRPDGPLAAFCSGDFPHMVVNGIDSHPGVTGRIIPYDCCDGGEFVVTTATFVDLITVSWQSQVGAASGYPATIDLANPPKGWNVRIVIGCDTATSSCYPPPDGYTTGLQGVLQVTNNSGHFDMSLCLHVEEPADSPHPIVHTLDLYAPHVKPN